MFARDHSLGISPLSIDCWKRWANIGPNSVANSFKTLGWSSSGLKAFEGFRPFSNFVTPSLVTTMSSMNGTDLSRRGTWLCSLLVNTRRDVPVGVPFDLSTPTGMSCIGTYGENFNSDNVSKYRVLLVAFQLL